ncbi:MAG TPA: 50S ribosomal protein L13 [Myxococcota bacterium]|nr:50S ribosomal protein L13 [Myxococcota bacterium]HRY95349.1 50S ribosomal protein L13 [Myxococcota bacterium]HSA21192.1 50S ribosomal protein L13 [Myxococcota bacterium]
MNTVHAKKNEIERRWLLIDAKDLVLGRVASEVASILRGKRKPSFTPHVDTGDFVVVVNAGAVRLTGKKWSEKMYYDHSGWVGGLRERTATEVLAKHPIDLVRRAVRGMLPKGPLGFAMIRKLKVYAGAEHPHVAQKPEAIKIAP